MNKHSELLKHRQISALGITEDGGIILRFVDESHTYIEPDDVKDIIIKLNELMNKEE